MHWITNSATRRKDENPFMLPTASRTSFSGSGLWRFGWQCGRPRCGSIRSRRGRFLRRWLRASFRGWFVHFGSRFLFIRREHRCIYQRHELMQELNCFAILGFTFRVGGHLCNRIDFDEGRIRIQLPLIRGNPIAVGAKAPEDGACSEDLCLLRLCEICRYRIPRPFYRTPRKRWG